MTDRGSGKPAKMIGGPLDGERWVLEPGLGDSGFFEVKVSHDGGAWRRDPFRTLLGDPVELETFRYEEMGFWSDGCAVFICCDD